MMTRYPHHPLVFMRKLLPVILLIWLHLFLRWHNIDQMPYFIDEIRHVERARIVWSFQDIHTSTTPSKFGMYYWLGLFFLPEYTPAWLARVPISLFTTIGIASAFALGKLLFGYRTGFIAGLLIAIWPWLVFFERMALTDPFTATWVTLTIWWSIVFAKSPTRRRAWILSIFLCMMLAAKLLTIFLLPIPLLVILLFGKYPLSLSKPLLPQLKAIWLTYRPHLLRISYVVGGIWGFILGFYQIRKWLYPDTRVLIDNYLYLKSVQGKAFFVPQNIERTGEVLYYHWSIPLIMLSLLAIVILWTKQRRSLILLSATVMLLWVPLIIIAKELSTRYLTIVAHFIAILIAGGLSQLWQHERSLLRFGSMGMAAIWIATFALPKIAIIMSQPEQLSLPKRDVFEYFQNNTSGYEIEEALSFVAENGDVPLIEDEPVVIAALRICDIDPNYVLYEPTREEIEIICQPRLSGYSPNELFEQRYQWINDVVEDYNVSYLVIEHYETQVEPITIEPSRVIGLVRRIARFERPHNGIPIEIYEIRTYPAPHHLARWVDAS
ncbi:MAG: hypothetical protein CUN55_09720 [Phototrophicales bacterium]|nr:MAG: hypothetical protein CUN55_09720 [Phototrophicales bacterium]